MFPSLELWLLAVALAADAAAVAAGLAARRPPIRVLVVAATLFGLFQAGMAGLGAVGGSWLVRVASAFDHWIAFVLLVGLGARMVRGGDEEGDGVGSAMIPGVATLIALSVATSIDALAAGVSLPLLPDSSVVALAVIGGVTTALAALAAWVGAHVGAGFGERLEPFGGLVLIVLGFKILAEHLLA